MPAPGRLNVGNAVPMSAEDYDALREGAYLLRSPANARRLLKAYENALSGATSPSVNWSTRTRRHPGSGSA
jgi:PHD/YefM family antitoxin component YafN of YafNO toxin-antitoxin module